MDRLITYWRGNPYNGLIQIVNRGLGHMMVNILDALARNAFLDNAYSLYGGGTGANFADISTYDEKMSTPLLDDIALGMAERNVPFAALPTGMAGNLICITSPGVYRDLQYEADGPGNANAFINVMKYADAARIIRGEVGTYHNVRFVRTPRAILYNCGPITVQTTIGAAHTAGDGSDPSVLVDGVRKVGQPSGVTHFISVADTTGFAVGDLVSIHINRTSNFGVTDGADYRDGTKQERRIVAINSPGIGGGLVLDKPIMTDFNVDLGGGVYGYVTKARHIHTAIFLGGLDGVVNGILQPPRIYTPPPVDDFMSMYRISWDASMGYQVFQPEVFEVHFGAGSTRPGTGPALR